MRRFADGFNQSRFARFLHSSGRRLFRILAGAAFLSIGVVGLAGSHLIGALSLAWGVLPLSAGALDICYISAALGGPHSGKQIRGAYQPDS